MGEITLVQTTTLPAAEEEIVLVRAAQQDPAHFSPIYMRYLNPVYSYLLAQVWDAEEAKDLTAQVFLQALQDLPKYRPIRPFSAWLFTIARHRAADYFRRRSQSPLDEEIHLTANSTDPLVEVLQNERLAHLQLVVRGLAEDEQELLRLRFAAGLGFSEIAALLGRKESAVKMAVYRILSRLEKQLGGDDD